MRDLNQTHQWAGVGGVWRVIIQKAREAKIGHFAHQVAVDEHVAGSQVTVDIVHVGQILHASCDPPQHANQLRYGKPAIVQLRGNSTIEEGEWH